MGKSLRIALIVGVDQYDDPRYNNLKGAVRDAAEINGFLKYRLPRGSEFETILLNNPTSAEVVNALTAIRKRLDDDSVFVFYFAGHDLTPENSIQQALLCSDASELVDEGVTDVGSISSNVITHFVRNGRGNMFFCFDVCRSPINAGKFGTTNAGACLICDSVAKIDRECLDGRPAACWLLCSCADGRLASDEGEFAASLIDAMNEEITSGLGLAFGDDLLLLVEKHLKKRRPNSNRYPEASGRLFAFTPCEKANKASDSALREEIERLQKEQELANRKLNDQEQQKTLFTPSINLSEFETSIYLNSTTGVSKASGSDSWIGSYAGERREIRIKGVSYSFRWIPSGTFQRANGRNVRLTQGFWCLETPVTQGQWTSIMGENPSAFCETGYYSGRVFEMDSDNFPVENVSWDDCQKYIEELNCQCPILCGNFRLPTEAEWEYACRAGTTTNFWWGDALSGDRANCNGNCPWGREWKGSYLERTCNAKSYEANPWGLYNVYGNVWEWCSDGFGEYPCYDVVDPEGDNNVSYHVIRGGGWRHGARCCSSAYRSCRNSTRRSDDLGFRFLLCNRFAGEAPDRIFL